MKIRAAFRHSLIKYLALFFCLIAGETKATELATQLLDNPKYMDPKLSPDGKHLAFISYLKGKRSIIIRNLKTQKMGGVTVESGQNIDLFEWIDSEHIAYIVSKWDIYNEGLFLYDLPANKARQLISPQKIPLLVRSIVDPLPQIKDRFLFEAFKFGVSNPPDLYEMQSDSKTWSKVADNTGDIVHWIANEDGDLLYGLESRSGYIHLLERDPENKAWQESTQKTKTFMPRAVLAGNQHLVFQAEDDDGYEGIGLYHLEKQEVQGKPRFLPGYDLDSGHIIFNNLNHRASGVHFHHSKPANFWFDPGMNQVESLLKSQFDNHVIEYLGMNPTERHMFFIISNDVTPPFICRLNLENGNIQRVFSQYYEIKDLEFRPMEAVSFPHSGTKHKIHGYLTKPKGKGPFPTVILLHGGPTTRDTWGFNNEVQFLALSGYAVMQVNYRGSTGYGDAYACDYELLTVAEKSVEDVIGAKDWLVQERIADPGNIAVMGGSYGGYLALAAAAQKNSDFAATIGYAGVYDFIALYQDDKRDGAHWFDDMYADFDEDLFTKLSPLHHVKNIQSPVLLIHGKSDKRVPFSQTQSMINGLEEAGKPVEHQFLNWGVHGLPNKEDRVPFYNRILTFLNQHLKSHQK